MKQFISKLKEVQMTNKLKSIQLVKLTRVPIETKNHLRD